MESNYFTYSEALALAEALWSRIDRLSDQILIAPDCEVDSLMSKLERFRDAYDKVVFLLQERNLNNGLL